MLLALALGCTGALPPPPAPVDGAAEETLGDSADGADSGGATGDTAAPGGGGTTGAGDSAAGDTGPDERSNLLMISIDTLRRDDVGRYSGRDTTPTLDALLADALVLERHRSCSNWTYPAMACVLTGLYNERYEDGYYPEEGQIFPDSATTLAERLSQAGWRSALVSAQGILGPGFNLSQGYGAREVDDGLGAAALTEAAVEAGAALRAEPGPWFLHVHYLDPHVPYRAPEAYERGADALPEIPVDLRVEEPGLAISQGWSGWDEQTRADVLEVLQHLYDAELRYMDDGIRALLAALEASGALERTLVVLVSDHGEQFREHDGFGHALDLYTEESLALAALWGRGVTPGTREISTSHVDLVPEILARLELADKDGIGGDAFDGAPLDTLHAQRPVFASVIHNGEVRQSVEIGDDRLLYWWDGQVGLYDLGRDPGETNDLFSPDDPTARDLWDALAPMTDALRAATETTPSVPAGL